MKTKSYKDLLVWQKGISLVEQIYILTKKLPAEEKFGLSSQLQRAAVSIPSNIAEGYKRHNIREYVQFSGIAAGSLAELETQLVIVSKIYSDICVSNLLKDTDELQKMLYSFIKALKTKRYTLNAVS
ncbi:hypothetical protein BVY00_01205 [bacterium G20]|nr:hypothetical protein BVY00_01205 [bacterium G20]